MSDHGKHDTEMNFYHCHTTSRFPDLVTFQAVTPCSCWMSGPHKENTLPNRVNISPYSHMHNIGEGGTVTPMHICMRTGDSKGPRSRRPRLRATSRPQRKAAGALPSGVALPATAVTTAVSAGSDTAGLDSPASATAGQAGTERVHP